MYYYVNDDKKLTIDQVYACLFNDSFNRYYGEAIALVKKELVGLDYGGCPNYLHALRMGSAAYQAGGMGGDVTTAAILHDVFEDTDITGNELSGMFGEKVWALVSAVSRKQGQTYFEFIQQVIDAGRGAIKIKLLDINDHLFYKENINESLIKRYVKAEQMLKGAL